MAKKNQSMDFLYAIFIVVVVAFIGYYAIEGYISNNTSKVQFDFEDISTDNIDFTSIEEENAFLMFADENSTTYSIVENSLSLSNNIEKRVLNYSELNEYEVKFEYTLSVDSNLTGQELRIDSGLTENSSLTQVLAHSIAYDEVEGTYEIEINGDTLVFINEYAVDTTQGFIIKYDFNELSQFVEVEVIRKISETENKLVYNSVSRIEDELQGNDVSYGAENFWVNYVIEGNENTSIQVDEISMRY